MATGDRKVNIFINRLLSKTALKEQFLEYLSNKLDGTISAFFLGQSGVMDEDPIGLAADGNDKFKLDLTLANKVAVGGGQTITIPDETDVSKGIKFENAAGVTYYVGVRYAEVPWQLVDVNPKYGNPEYPSIEDSLGELAAPNLVTNTPGVKIALRINSITEAGVDHSGRSVKVWLNTPVSGVAGTAYYQGTSYYSGGHNYVDIPYSGGNGPLGQDTSSGPPSTTPGDYRVFIKGVSWKRNTDLRLDSDYAFIGTVLGVGAGSPPATFDITDQQPIFIITLDRAYDGPGVGLGRKINIDAGAVEMFTGTDLSGDDEHQMQRFDRLGSTQWAQFMLAFLTGDQSACPIMTLQPMQYAGCSFDEPCTTSSTQRINFTRVGADLTGLRISKRHHFVLLQGTSQDGLYGISAFGTNYIDAYDLRTGAAPSSWPASTGSAWVLSARFVIGHSGVLNNGGEDLNGFSFILNGADDYVSPIKILPENGTSDDLIQLYDNNDPPWVIARLRNVWIAAYTYALQWEIGRTLEINPGYPHTYCPGIKIQAHAQTNADVQALNIHAGPALQDFSESYYNRVAALHNQDGAEVLRLTHLGRLVRPSEFFEDFENIAGNPWPYRNWSEWTGGAGSTAFYYNSSSDQDAGGIVRCHASGASGTFARIYTPNDTPCYMRHYYTIAIERVIYFAGRFKVGYSGGSGWGYQDSGLWLEFISGAKIGARFLCPGAYTSQQFEFFVTDGVTTTTSIGKGSPGNAGVDADEYGWFEFEMRIDIAGNSISFSHSKRDIANPNGIDAFNFVNPASGNWKGRAAIIGGVYIYDTNAHSCSIDYAHVWDGVLRAGRKDKNS